MAFESFYGGRPGASLVIVHQYSSYSDMVEDFKQGGLTTSIVNYGEYVVINNRLDPDYHGNVYRRGLNYAEIVDGVETGGAQFIGNMAGPQGEPGGIHIIGLVSSVDELDGKKPEDYGDDYKGWVMAVESEVTGERIPDLQAYDYINEEQFYIGNLPYAPYTVKRTTVDYDDIA